MKSARLTVESNAADATRRLGEAVARLLDGPAVLALAGDLGAGKTTFVQGLGRGFGIAGAITSPTFVLINRHRCADGRYLQHADCYRLSNAPLEMWDAGLADLMWGEDVVVVEWADRAYDLLPAEHLDVAFTYLDSDTRRMDFVGTGDDYARAVGKLAAVAEQIAGITLVPVRQRD